MLCCGAVRWCNCSVIKVSTLSFECKTYLLVCRLVCFHHYDTTLVTEHKYITNASTIMKRKELPTAPYNVVLAVSFTTDTT